MNCHTQAEGPMRNVQTKFVCASVDLSWRKREWRKTKAFGRGIENLVVVMVDDPDDYGQFLQSLFGSYFNIHPGHLP